MIYGECNFQKGLGGNMLVKISCSRTLSGLLAGGLRPPLWVLWGCCEGVVGVGVPQPCHPSTHLTQGLGGGGHCLFKGRYPLPIYRPRFSGLSAPEFSLTAPYFGGLTDHRPLKSNFLNTELYTKGTPIIP